MPGGSYGGGIQFVTAAIDSRLDAIAPVIAWHSLVTSLYKAQAPKSRLGRRALRARRQAPRPPASPLGSRQLDPHITSAYTLRPRLRPVLRRGRRVVRRPRPRRARERIRVPTLILQGTVDTLFTLDEAITNYRDPARNRVPPKLIWFCGGHGACLTDAGPAGDVERPDRGSWFAPHLSATSRSTPARASSGSPTTARCAPRPDYPPAVSRSPRAGPGCSPLNPPTPSVRRADRGHAGRPPSCRRSRRRAPRRSSARRS